MLFFIIDVLEPQISSGSKDIDNIPLFKCFHHECNLLIDLSFGQSVFYFRAYILSISNIPIDATYYDACDELFTETELLKKSFYEP